jgi:hypothetical protein
MTSARDEQPFSAGDVRRVTGLSSRQLNDWDQRGVLPHARTGDAGWRKFSPRQMFALMVAAEARKQFGVPVERLKWMTDFMMAEGANHLRVAAEMIAVLGVNVWIATDLEDTFVMDSDLEMHDLFGMGGFSRIKGLIFIRVNPLVERFLGDGEDSIPLPLHGRGYEFLAQMATAATLSPSELHVLGLIRGGEYESIEIVLRDGEITRIKRSKQQDVAAKVQDLIQSEDFQSLRIHVRDGQVVSLEQEVTEKP